jgi:hypothetical protein
VSLVVDLDLKNGENNKKKVESFKANVRVRLEKWLAEVGLISG